MIRVIYLKVPFNSSLSSASSTTHDFVALGKLNQRRYPRVCREVEHRVLAQNRTCEKTNVRPFVLSFPLFVPSLSW